MYEPYQWRDPMPEFLKRFNLILDSVAGVALQHELSPVAGAEPVADALADASPCRKLKSDEVCNWLKALPAKVANTTTTALIREGSLDDAERANAVQAAVLGVTQATPADLARRLAEHGYLNGYTYTFDGLRMMIGRVIRNGALPCWTGGKVQKAAAVDGNDEHDVDAEFNPRKRRRSDNDDQSAPSGMTIRNRLHTSATPSQKAARRGRRPSRDDQAISKMSGISDEAAAEARAFFEQHPELREG